MINRNLKSMLKINSTKRLIAKAFLYFMFFAIAFSSCKKNSDEVSTTPSITIQSLTPGTIKQFSDTLTMIIAYEDGDGDLGENNSTAKNLFVTDKRINITTAYRISELAPQGSAINIKGTLKLYLSNIPVLNGNNSESYNYDVYVKDRAGNTSNVVTSSSVTVLK